MNNLEKLRNIRGALETSSRNSETYVSQKKLPQLQVENLPLVISPKLRGVSLVRWITEKRYVFNELLLKHAAILFRGFHIDSLDSFGTFVNSFNSDPIPYMFRSSPRHQLDHSIKNVYNSTVYPKTERINLHNESSYARNWGQHIIFCCLKTPEEGGETPIADSREILKSIDPKLVQKFREKGVRYHRTLNANTGMSWQEVFQTDHFDTVKEICHRNRIDFRWQSEEQLEISWNKQAICTHPVSGEESWFNHIYFFNKYSRYEELGIDPGDIPSKDLIHSNTTFGDGSEISYQEYSLIKNAYERNTISFPYKTGDVLFLDNMLVAHGRNPYKGDRLIATAILNPISETYF